MNLSETSLEVYVSMVLNSGKMNSTRQAGIREDQA